MATYTDAIQKLYVAYFNRPADFAGLTYWEGVVEAAKGDTSAVSKAFAASDEYKKAYAGMDAYHVLNQVYNNLFGHDADLPGLQFWGPKLQAGSISIDSVVTTVAAGAQGTDLAAYNAKVAAATAFSNQLDTASEILGYSGDVANGMAKQWLSTVKDSATLTTAIADAALAATVNSITHPPVPGQTFAVTHGLDTITGTAGDDIINAYAFNTTTGNVDVTLQPVDTIDGGAGNDTLNLEVNGASNATLAGTVTNVETININESSGLLAAKLNAGFFSGAKTVNQIGAAVSVTGLSSSTTAGFKSLALDTTADFDPTTAGVQSAKVTASSTAAAANIALTSVKGDASNVAHLDVAGASLSAVNVSGTLAKNSGVAATPKLALNITGGADAAGKSVTSVSVNTAVKTDLSVVHSGTGGIATVDASASTGIINFVGAENTVANIKSGAGNDTLSLNTAFTTSVTSASIDGGAGNDDITVNVSGTGNFTANGGDGNDTIHVSQALMAAGNHVDGGAGSDTVVFGNPSNFAAGDYVLVSNVVSNVETLELANAVTTLDASKVSQFANLTFDADATGVTKVGQAVLTHANLTASAVGYAASSSASGSPTYAGNLNVTVDTDGKALALSGDTATVNVDSSINADANVGTTMAGDLSTSLTVNLTNSTDDTPASFDYLSSVTINVAATKDASNNPTALGALKSLVLTGDGSATVTSTGSVKLATIDASALGGTLKVPASAGNITGGLTFTGNAGVAESITVGSGHDVLTINSTYAKMDTITGFDANHETADGDLTSTNDVLTFGGVTMGGTGVGNHSTLTKVALTSADSTLDLAFIHAATASAAATNAVVFFQFGGNTYLFQNLDPAGVTAGTLDNGDLAVKLVGTYDFTKDFSLHASPAA
ncbi:MAG: DUF4214 domain-containing protein [Telluria sp.]